MISKLVGDALCPDSLYQKLIQFNEFPLLDTKKTYVIDNSTLTDIMQQSETLDVARRYHITELQVKLSRLEQDVDVGFPIVMDNLLSGYIGYTELSHAINTSKQQGNTNFPCFFKRKRKIGTSQFTSTWETEFDVLETNEPNDYTRWMDQAPITVDVMCSVDVLLEMFVKLGLKVVIVVDGGRYVGLVYKKALVRWLNEGDSR